MSDLLDAVEAEWCEGLGCHRQLLHRPGVHLVPGGESLMGYPHVYLARFGPAVLVYCPHRLIDRAERVIEGSTPDEVFTLAGAMDLGGDLTAEVLGPSRHAFVDREHFRADDHPMGVLLQPGDPGLARLREACGEAEWTESGLGVLRNKEPVYGITQGRVLAGAGKMSDYRQHPADVGVLTHPAFRGRGLARALVSRMVEEALPGSGIVRYRALVTNLASLSVATSLGFVARGENLVARLADG